MVAFLTLNIERFLGKTFPIFHRASVPKKSPKEKAFTSIFEHFGNPRPALSHINRVKTLGHIIVMADLSIFLFLITRWGTCALASIGFGTRGGCQMSDVGFPIVVDSLIFPPIIHKAPANFTQIIHK